MGERRKGEQQGGETKPLSVCDLRPSMSDLALARCVVLRHDGVTRVQDKGMASLVVADDTASVRLSVWHPLPGRIQEGDVVLVVNAKTRLHHSQLFVYCNDSDIERVGEFCFLFKCLPNMSEVGWRLSDHDTALSAMVPTDKDGNDLFPSNAQQPPQPHAPLPSPSPSPSPSPAATPVPSPRPRPSPLAHRPTKRQRKS